MWATRGLTPTCQFSRLYVHPRAAPSAHPLSLLPQLRALVFLKVLTGIEEWLVDRGMRGVAELREETSRRGAIRDRIRVSAGFKAGELGVNIVISGMADRRDWGGGGDDPEESTQRMIERIWESLTDIRARMDQQAPIPPVAVPPGEGEAVPVAPVLPRVEVKSRLLWTFSLAVHVGDKGVDANLSVQQVSKSGWLIVGRAASPNCARKRCGVVQFAWELAEGLA
ncbi:hypothetical protein Taro_014590 [Colocasia esculenta]|uniref:Uncharacterized protein n=1 Tax=Colocasia esculenta TaxID=4460 RepID=A0A843UMA0_COLES|nr:hypothetical protein [Colocasia esculenta]